MGVVIKSARTNTQYIPMKNHITKGDPHDRHVYQIIKYDIKSAFNSGMVAFIIISITRWNDHSGDR